LKTKVKVREQQHLNRSNDVFFKDQSLIRTCLV